MEEPFGDSAVTDMWKLKGETPLSFYEKFPPGADQDLDERTLNSMWLILTHCWEIIPKKRPHAWKLAHDLQSVLNGEIISGGVMPLYYNAADLGRSGTLNSATTRSKEKLWSPLSADR